MARDLMKGSWGESLLLRERSHAFVLKILMPGQIHAYNSHMGGVDLFDKYLANYNRYILSDQKSGGGPYFNGE